MSDEMEPAVVEIERLRAALKRIAYLRPAGDCKNRLVIEMEAIAIHALRDSGSQPQAENAEGG